MAVLFGVFFLFLVLGTPIAMSMFISSISYMVVYDLPLELIAQRLAAGVDSFTLLAVAFFVFVGNVMNLGGVTQRIFSFADHLVGHFTGGLAHTNVLASVIFSGMSGSAIADTGGLGAIELKAMKDGGYDEDFSLAVTGASSLIGPVIPPSVPLVIFGVTASVSVGSLFNAGIIPGLILAAAMMTLNYFICKKKGYKVRKKATGKEIWVCFKWAFLALLLPLIIRGGILFGIFTPTESAIVAAAYAIALGVLYKNVNMKVLPGIIKETLNITVGVLFVIASATLFSWVLTFSQIPQTVAVHLLELTDNPLIALFIVSGILLFIGLFMDVTPAIVIMTPVLMPFITALGIDPVMFGIIMVLNLLVGLVTPPVGMVLFVLSGVSGVSIQRISKAIIPYALVSVLTIVLIIVYTYLMTVYPFLPKPY